ncbi:MAG: CBS domain-containing protein [Armatimonadetes bacterium]|nr:MAG: CBS domain-containing protein [Armatimonadota bacterium]
MRKTVAHILEYKGQDVWSVPSTMSVFEAVSMMADKNIGALVVIDDEVLTGILSERDYARKIILHGRSSRDTSVGEIMTPDPVTVTPADTVAECMELMTANRFRHLPVVDGGTLLGVVSIGDVVGAVIDHQKFVIDQLEGYITG